MKHRIYLALALSCVTGGAAQLAQAATDSIDVAAPAHLKTELYARGVQIYRCAAATADAKSGSWVFQAPEADLFSDKSMQHLVGKHFDGPHWQGNDGSLVAGVVEATRPAKEANAIPWLRLSATAASQPGIFAGVSHIQRVNTHGGATGPTLCDAATFGATLKVPYTATYRFYTQ